VKSTESYGKIQREQRLRSKAAGVQPMAIKPMRPSQINYISMTSANHRVENRSQFISVSAQTQSMQQPRQVSLPGGRSIHTPSRVESQIFVGNHVSVQNAPRESRRGGQRNGFARAYNTTVDYLLSMRIW
jgi:hypothetical protein